MPKRDSFRDLTGGRFGTWTVIRFHERRKYLIHWWCRCDCGTERSVYGNTLTSIDNPSCGCVGQKTTIEKNTTHGYSRTPTYNVWCCMKRRCLDPKNPAFNEYGGRGISVCKRWENSFEDFLEDMGKKPDKLTLDRIKNDLGYCKENCRWAIRKQQARNRRGNRIIAAFGEELTISEWSEKTGIKQGTIRQRIVEYGWDAERAVSK